MRFLDIKYLSHALEESALTLTTPAQAEAVLTELLSLFPREWKGIATLKQEVTSRAKCTRNEVQSLATEGQLGVHVEINTGSRILGETTRLDSEGLKDLARFVTEAAHAVPKDPDVAVIIRDPATFTDPPIYFDNTVTDATPAAQGDLVRAAAEAAAKVGLVAAATVEATAKFLSTMNTANFRGHTRSTYGEFTMTARTPKGTASGWAWGGGDDFSKVDPAAVTAKAIELCQQSENAIAVEPGRYTVILEPEATARIMAPITDYSTIWMDSANADVGQSVYSKKEGGNKLGLLMTDRRVHIGYDPNDPDLPFSPLKGNGYLFQRTPWVDQGILTNLAWQAWYAQQLHRTVLENPEGMATLRIDGPTQTLEEMIATTKRGIWVHHIAGVMTVNNRTLLLTGATQDGTFLIENGKITHPIKNLRFMESPFFILNKLDAWGPTQRASKIWAAPRLKVHDFDFTSMTDAV